MFLKRNVKKSMNIAIISDYLDHFFDDPMKIFNFSSYFLCEFSRELQSQGQNLTVVLPFHKKIENSKMFKAMSYLRSDEVILPDREGKEDRKIEINFYNCSGVNVIFVKDPYLSEREGYIFDPANGMFYPDNLLRFSNLSRSAIESLKLIPFKPDVVHVVGKWASISSIYLKTIYKYDNFFAKSRLVFTIDSLEELPIFVVDQYPILGLDWSYYRYDCLEFFGKVNIVKGSIVFSDCIVFTSNSYVDEIRKEEFGKGLEGLIQQKFSESKIKSILPGISHQYSPQKDKVLSSVGFNYTRDNIENKKKVKNYIAKKHGFSPESLFFMFFGEFKENSGISLVYEIFSEILPKFNVSLVIFGRGDDFRENAIGELVNSYNNKVIWFKDFSYEDVILYLASSDVLLMPSVIESSSILPMVALVYGTLPLVRGVGILNDVVRDKINGFKFYEYSPTVFKEKILECYDMYYKNPKRWNKLVETAMKSEFSWSDTVKHYVEEVYTQTKK